MASKKTEVLEALETALETVPGVSLVAWDKIRVVAEDFAEHETPAIQFYMGDTNYFHEQGRLRAESEIAIECVLRGGNGVTQGDLLDFMDEIVKTIGAHPNLNVKSVLHFQLLSDEVDLHSIDPFYVGRLNFLVVYHTTYSGC